MTSGNPPTSYEDPYLVAIYDPLNPMGPDDRFYLGLAGKTPLDILDIGCGTGRLATALAVCGHHVTGIEPAAAMLDVARARPVGDQVAWHQASGAGFAFNRRFDLITMTGHAFQALLDDDAMAGTLANAHRHLKPGGRLAFESRNPPAREWETWPTDRDRVETAMGPVDVGYEIVAVDGDLVTFAILYDFADGERRRSVDTIRFIDKTHLAALVRDAGFAEVTWLGDWDGTPWSEASPEIVTIARRGND